MAMKELAACLITDFTVPGGAIVQKVRRYAGLDEAMNEPWPAGCTSRRAEQHEDFGCGFAVTARWHQSAPNDSWRPAGQAVPATGKIPVMTDMVVYALTEEDAIEVNKRRQDFTSHRASDGYTDTGYIAHRGDAVCAGDEFPAVVVRSFSNGRHLNLRVILDGSDDLRRVAVQQAAPATQDTEAAILGRWAWPKHAG